VTDLLITQTMVEVVYQIVNNYVVSQVVVEVVYAVTPSPTRIFIPAFIG